MSTAPEPTTPERLQQVWTEAMAVRAANAPEGADPAAGLAGFTATIDGLRWQAMSLSHEPGDRLVVTLRCLEDVIVTLPDPSPEHVKKSRAFSGVIR